MADQEAAGVVADKPTRPAAAPAAPANNGSNNPRTMSPKAQLQRLKSARVQKLGELHGGGKTRMIALAEVVTEAAQDGVVTVEQSARNLRPLQGWRDQGVNLRGRGRSLRRSGAWRGSGEVNRAAVSKLRQFVILGDKYESDALDLVRKARNMHIELLRAANGDAEVKKGIKPGSTYSVLVDVARAQLGKQKKTVEAGKKAGVKSTALAPLLTNDEMRTIMTQEVNEPVDKTGEDYLLDTLIIAKATVKGSDKRNAITCEELDNAISWLRAALGKVAPDCWRSTRATSRRLSRLASTRRLRRLRPKGSRPRRLHSPRRRRLSDRRSWRHNPPPPLPDTNPLGNLTARP